MKVILIAAAVAAGALLPLQAGLSGRLGKALDSPILSALAAKALGTLAVLAFAIATRAPVPTGSTLAQVPPWAWIGGILGAAYLTAAILLPFRIGLATATAAAIAGQMIVSVGLDHFRVIGFETHPVSLARLAGAAMVIGGAILIQRT